MEVLAETKTSLRSAQDDLRRVSLSAEKAVSQAGDGSERALDQAASVLEQTAGAVSDGRPIIRSGARIADSAARVAEHYEKEWTRGSAWSKAKYIFNAILQVPWVVK